MKFSFLKILRKYKKFKAMVYEFWHLYLIIRELMVIIKEIPQLNLYYAKINKVLRNIWVLKTDVFGEEK